MTRFKLPTATLKGPFRAIIEKLRVVLRRVTVGRGTRAAGRRLIATRPAPEVFYRAMSHRELRGLTETGRLTVRGESSVTQDPSFVRQLAARHPKLYEVMVRFEMQPGTRAALLEVGARSRGRLLEQEGLGGLPAIGKGMTSVVHIKAEAQAITYGLRPGSAAVFNSRIGKFGVLDD